MIYSVAACDVRRILQRAFVRTLGLKIVERMAKARHWETHSYCCVFSWII